MATSGIHTGNTMRYLNAGSALLSGDIIEYGADADGFGGVLTVNLATGESGAVDYNGVHTLPKDTGVGSGGAQGAKAYWDGTKVTVVATANHLIGWMYETNIDADTTAKVKLGG